MQTDAWDLKMRAFAHPYFAFDYSTQTFFKVGSGPWIFESANLDSC